MKSFFEKWGVRFFMLLLLCAACILCSSCSPGYEKYRTEENVADTAKVDAHSFSAYFFVLPEGDAVLEICDDNNGGEVYQTIEFPKESEHYASLDFDFAFVNAIFQDMNFDGFVDLYVPCSVTTENLEGMAWLWDTGKAEFVFSEELSALYELTVFPDEELITSQDYSHPDGIYCTEYKWENGKLVLTGEYTVNY